jgi:diguanylate cyclase (GGDEF)-like protein
MPDQILLPDKLTGLSSRIGVETYLKDLSHDEDAIAEGIVVFVVELSRFGKVNDSMGADLGDKIICTVAKRLEKVFPHAGCIARTHGDHFCLVFKGEVNVQEQIDLLNDFTQRPLALRGEVVVLSVRAGVAELSPLLDSPMLLLHAAEVALHSAKHNKKKLCFFTHDLESDVKKAHRLENDLRVSLVTNHAALHKAVSNNEFQLLYQPIVDIATYRVHSLEALIRWHHPQRGMVSPVEFIPMAEQIQIMDVLGNWIIRRACMDALKFPLNADGSRPGVSVNISATQFNETGILVAAVKQALSESGLEPRLLQLEITESAAFNLDKIEILEALRALGCQVALDDFGTGYSSLTQLNILPLDFIKLDRSFICALGGEDALKDQRSDRITRAVLSIAQTFRLVNIVEGVETTLQCERVQSYGANLIQGFLFSKPLALDEACEFVTAFNQNHP